MSKPTTALISGEVRTAPKGDYFVVCSFDKNHILLRSRMPYHIHKCKKNFPNHTKIQCPYDGTEYIEEADFTNHILTCESAQIMGNCNEKYERARLEMSGRLCNSERDPPPFHHKYAPEATEDWSEVEESRMTETEKMKGVAKDESEDYLTKGVGRGLKMRGRGRAELLAIVMKEYEKQQNALGRRSSYTSSDRSSGTSSTPGQFSDE